jgi:hypothetical protein
MRIDPSNLSGTPISAADAGQPASPAAPGAQSTPAVDDRSQHLPSPELQQLTAAVRNLPEVREDVVQRVAGQLAAGQYLTPEAAEQTAQAMLGGAG